MPNFMVTITGADDKVNPDDIVALSEKYPFVEWGILFSATSPGIKRYPSKNWRLSMYAAHMMVKHTVSLSAHLCGGFVDQRLASKDFLATEVETFYDRVQFNRFNHENLNSILEYSKTSGCNVVIPSNKKTNTLVDLVREKSHIAVLFDESGGSGMSPTVWPEHLPSFLGCGYAGGIGEENIDRVLETLISRYKESPFWIDLETGARDQDNEFDIDKVDRILKRAQNHLEKKSSIILIN